MARFLAAALAALALGFAPAAPAQKASPKERPVGGCG